jgi:hypothetical protein
MWLLAWPEGKANLSPLASRNKRVLAVLSAAAVAGSAGAAAVAVALSEAISL